MFEISAVITFLGEKS